MPLTGSESTLSAAIKAARLAGNPDAEVVDNDALQADCDAIASAVIAHITANAVVVGACPGGPGGPLTGGIIT